MTYELIGEAQAPNDTTTSLEVENIPDTYKHLQCIIAGTGYHSSNPTYWTGRFNDKGGGAGEDIYQFGLMIASGTSGAYPWTTGNEGSADQFYFGYNNGVSPYDVQGITILDVYDYTDTANKKSWTSYGGTIDETSTSSGGDTMVVGAGSFPWTEAITKISINMNGNNMQTGCTLRVFGWGAP